MVCNTPLPRVSLQGNPLRFMADSMRRPLTERRVNEAKILVAANQIEIAKADLGFEPCFTLNEIMAYFETEWTRSDTSAVVRMLNKGSPVYEDWETLAQDVR